jgi:UDP-2,3-diacylglucosamine pyrophosphatase LpxH
MDLKKKIELTFESDFNFSDKIENPTVIDPSNPIKLIFSEYMNMETVSAGIKLFKIGLDNEEVEDVKITSQENAPNILFLNKPATLVEAEEYKLSINTQLKSLNDTSLKEEFITYFATDYSFNLKKEGIPDLNNQRSLIIIISDLHLGANDIYTETKQNRDALVSFLKQVRVSPHVKELVIAGDLIDEWFVPMHIDTFNGKTQRDFVKALAKNNKSIFNAFNDMIKDGNVNVTYVPGNHDILIDSSDIQSVLPGISEARDVKGLGAYVPPDFPELIIEHGHRYNFFCAPDFSNRSITNTGSILPPGYFFTRMATSSVIEGRPENNNNIPVVSKNELSAEQLGYFLYWNIWKELITVFPVNEGIEEKVLKTGLDGLTEVYAISDFLPYQDPETGYIDVKLHNGIIENWDERQNNNLVPVKIPMEEAVLKAALASHLDDQSQTQFFDNPNSDKRIVIFGHSHEARVITSLNKEGKKQIYVNSGTWIDKNKCTKTFVVVAPPKNKDAPAFVNLYQYGSQGEIKKLKSEAINDLKMKF